MEKKLHDTDQLIYAGYHIGISQQCTTSSGIVPALYNNEIGIELIIPIPMLKIFGYTSAGPALGIIGNYRTDNIEEQKEAIIKILSLDLKNCTKTPIWYDIKQYLYNYKGKMRLSKIIPMSNVDANAIKRVITIIDDEYQNIVKNIKTTYEQ